MTGLVEVRRWYELYWRADQPDSESDQMWATNPTVYAGELRDFDGDEKHVQHRWSSSHLQAEGTEDQNLRVAGWDLALVKKVYSGQRAQYLARK